MDVRKSIGAAGVLLVAGLACGQVQEVARTVENTEEFGFKPTDTGISVGEEVIVITTNHGVIMFDKAGNLLDRRPLDDAMNPFPFIRVETDPVPMGAVAASRWFDPRSDYDPVHNRQWMSYSETNADNLTQTPGIPVKDDISALHLAVTKDPSDFPQTNPDLDTFDDSHWWYYTGTSGDPGSGDVAFDMADDDMLRYLDGGPHNPFPASGTVFGDSALFDLPIIAIDERAVYVSAFGTYDGGQAAFFDFANIFIIPIDFNDGSPRSMLDGDKPNEALITSLRLRDLPADPDDPLPPIIEYEPDFQQRHYPVQEPFGQVENCQLFISIANSGDEQDAVRLAGLWFDDDAQPEPRWYYTQHIENNATDDYPLDDVDVNFKFFYRNDSYEVTTPDGNFNPNTGGGFISSAVLAKDAHGNLRVFAAHYVVPSDEDPTTPNPEMRYVVQWYVIDPDLGTSPDNFRAIQNPPVWNPQIVESGRIETDGTNAGDCTFPSIGVTRTGLAYIEYTFSNGETWPQIRRVKLTSDYSAVDTNVLLKAGPINRSYEDDNPSIVGDPHDSWADFSDMQHDPFLCKFWSVHTLVHQPTFEPDPTAPVDMDRRDIWLFENRYTPFCFTTDMNQSGFTDGQDLALFTDYYDARDTRADTDADEVVDVIDMLNYLHEYDRVTSP